MEGAEVLGDAGIEPVTSLSCSTVLLSCPRQRPRASQRRSSFIHCVIRVSSAPARRHSRAVCLTGGCSSSPRNPPSRIPATSASRSAWPPASPRSSVTAAVGLARVIWRGAVPVPLGSQSGGFDKGRWPVSWPGDRAGFWPARISLRYSALKVNWAVLWHSGSRGQGFRVIAGGWRGHLVGAGEICGSGETTRTAA